MPPAYPGLVRFWILSGSEFEPDTRNCILFLFFSWRLMPDLSRGFVQRAGQRLHLFFGSFGALGNGSSWSNFFFGHSLSNRHYHGDLECLKHEKTRETRGGVGARLIYIDATGSDRVWSGLRKQHYSVFTLAIRSLLYILDRQNYFRISLGGLFLR